MDTDEEEETKFQEVLEEEGRPDANLKSLCRTVQQRFSQDDRAAQASPQIVAGRRTIGGETQPATGARGSGQGPGLGGAQAAGVLDPRGMAAPVDTNTNLQMMIVVMMQRVVEKMGQDTAPLGSDSGAGVGRTLNKMRALKQKLKTDPESIVTTFEDVWEETLGARGRPWRWRDVADHVNWKRYLSLKRAFVLMGKALELNRAGHHMQANAQLVQNMQALKEMSVYGDWKVAWPVTHLPDPIGGRVHGAHDEELEAILARLKVESDLDRNILRASKDHPSPGAGTEDSKERKRRTEPQKKKWWKKDAASNEPAAAKE
eukprot:TRINITY_DN42861_c0_g1_i1.p2 TRINITY_DN42861_c0_g1~~TRINITY_DN42861_c0_g1_i1.p2  ORF type:complete len:317 (-),score=54.78 TRINITY_DN42861_c0_g1_i1:318-1268(-)